MAQKRKPLIQISSRVTEELASAHRRIASSKKITLSEHISNILESFIKKEEKLNKNELNGEIDSSKENNATLLKNLSDVNKSFDSFVEKMIKTAGGLPDNQDSREVRVKYLIDKFDTNFGKVILSVMGDKSKHIKSVKK
jgi:hypothetical protein